MHKKIYDLNYFKVTCSTCYMIFLSKVMYGLLGWAVEQDKAYEDIKTNWVHTCSPAAMLPSEEAMNRHDNSKPQSAVMQVCHLQGQLLWPEVTELNNEQEFKHLQEIPNFYRFSVQTYYVQILNLLDAEKYTAWLKREQ